MKLVIIESPYAARPGGSSLEENVSYARKCLADSLKRGEAPFASHLLYTQPDVLNDGDPLERALGMDAGFAWGKAAELSAFYVDRGVSSGMWAGLDAAQRAGRECVVRHLFAPWVRNPWQADVDKLMRSIGK